jgi:hypothetical protein
MVIIGFIGSSEMIGVSSFCRFWGLGGTVYNVFLNFFRSNAWSVEVLAFQWAAFVLSQNVVIQKQGRAVLLGDHTCAPKDARRMPGVTTLHQHSETQTRQSYVPQVSTPGSHTGGLRNICFNCSVDAPAYAASCSVHEDCFESGAFPQKNLFSIFRIIAAGAEL